MAIPQNRDFISKATFPENITSHNEIKQWVKRESREFQLHVIFLVGMINLLVSRIYIGEIIL